MRGFLAIKYYEDMRNKDLIEKIYSIFKTKNIELFVFARNVQNYGPCTLTGKEIMTRAFKEIQTSNIFVIEASEMSIGIGVEAGVAYSSGIPIYLIAKKGVYVSNSIKGISEKQFFYNSPDELSNFDMD